MEHLNYKPKYPVQTLEKALDIIIYLKNNSSNSGVSISELSEKLNFGKSSVHRILDTLLAYNFVEKSDNMCYRLGWGLFDAGSMAIQQHTLGNSNYIPLLEKLCNEFSETVNLGIFNNYEAVIIYKCEPNVIIRSNMQIGQHEELHSTALGKLFMSEFSDDEIRNYFKIYTVKATTKNTITDADKMIEEIDKIRKQGYSVDNEEFCESLTCISMPVRNFSGKIAFAISISGPSARLKGKKLKAIKASLKIVCKELSSFMGSK